MSPYEKQKGYQNILQSHKPYRLVRMMRDSLGDLVMTSETDYWTLDEAREAAQVALIKDAASDNEYAKYFIARRAVEEVLAVDPVSMLPNVTQVWKYGF